MLLGLAGTRGSPILPCTFSVLVRERLRLQTSFLGETLGAERMGVFLFLACKVSFEHGIYGITTAHMRGYLAWIVIKPRQAAAQVPVAGLWAEN